MTSWTRFQFRLAMRLYRSALDRWPYVIGQPEPVMKRVVIALAERICP